VGFAMLLRNRVAELGGWHSSSWVDGGDRRGSAAKRRAWRREVDGICYDTGCGGMRLCCSEVGKLAMERVYWPKGTLSDFILMITNHMKLFATNKV